MVDLHWKSNIVNSDMPTKLSPTSDIPRVMSLPPLTAPFHPIDISASSSPACSAYDNYLRLPQLRKLWSSNDFPDWKSEPVFKPALHALEITFRLLFTVLLDPRPYANRRQWLRRIESLAVAEIETISILCEDDEEDPDTRGTVPTADLSKSEGVSYSEASLLPRLATWYKSKDVAQRILYTVESQMRRCPYTLGLGEMNIAGKPSLRYDAVCKPSEIHSLNKAPNDDLIESYENQTVYTTHQIIESWIHVTRQLLGRITERIRSKRFDKAADDCYMVERIWKLLADIEELHLLMDPDDFLRLKSQLSLRSTGETTAICFRSKELVEVTTQCRDLKHKVPEILEVEADPKGGPRIQEAAMKLYVDKNEKGRFEKVQLLQAMQGIESAMKRFFFTYKQVLVVVMGSSEASCNRVGVRSDSGDSLSQIYLEPTYFPSLDAAKTFLGYFWDNEHRC
ncbi:nematode resistance protein-like HSPRO2 [Prosopis cineraria]|uniref:nematode resistance protein-like HSPRO2 n=1 Tax=Prosopis cineraria TaxID=364024 RepID=UPI00240FB265|nr:nematode resistance protein-like HSPRO2 [Prosopis cineraria]